MAGMIALALIVALAVEPTPLHVGEGDDVEAVRIRTVADDAAALVESGEHEAALARIAAAEAEKPSPAFIFMRGVVEEDRGRCSQAIVEYRRFLELEVPTEDAEAARAGLRRCGFEPEAATTSPEPILPPTAAPPPTEVTSARDTPPERPAWYRDPIGGALLGVGVVSIAVGGTLWGLSAREAGQARDEDMLSQFDARARRAERMQPAGIAMVAIGGALAIAAAVRYGVLARRGRSPSRSTAAIYFQF